MLDLLLPPCWESGRIDRRLIQEPLDARDSLDSSATASGERSPWCLKNECLLTEPLGDESCEECGRW